MAARKAKRQRKPKADPKPKREDAPDLVPQKHGGALYSGGVKGNKGGGYVSAARRYIRKQLLKTIAKRGGLELIRQVIQGEELPLGSKNGEVVRGLPTLDQRKAMLDTALRFGLGEISQHAILNENDEVLEAGVVELPMLDAPLVPPPEADAPAQVQRTAIARDKALSAAQALIEAAK